ANGDVPHVAMFDANQAFMWSFAIDEGMQTAMVVIEGNQNTFQTAFYATWSTGVKATVIKFSANGQIIWYKNFAVDAIEGLYEDANGNLYCSGYSNVAQSALIFKLDPAGSIVWAKNINANAPYNFARGIEESPDGNLVIIGATSFNNVSNNQVTITKIDKQGNFVWGKIYESTAKSIMATGFAQSKQDNTFLMAGYCGSLANVDNLDLFSMKFDTAGNHVNNKVLSYNWWDQYYSVAAISDGGFVLTGLSKPVQTCGGNVVFVKMDNNNDTTVVKVYGNPSGTGAIYTDIKYSNIKGITAFGTGSLFESTTFGADYQCLELSPQLDLPCHFRQQNFNQSTLPVSQVGNTSLSNRTINVSDTYTKLVDNLGAVDACTQQVLSVSDIENVISMRLFPNPCSTKLTVQLDENKSFDIKVYSILGELITAKSACKYEFELETSQWKSGHYFIKINTNKGQRTESFIVE
nr:T9SS type A sorting domain-containing protein [Chitinophagaceae bacterium]